MKGLTFWICLGKWAQPVLQIEDKPFMIRFVFGWLSILLIAVDMDRMVGELLGKWEKNK